MTEDPVALAAIRSITRRAGLKEAVGLLYRPPGEVEIVLALDNLSDEPETSYTVSTASVKSALQLLVGDDWTEVEEADFVVWHSHPSGLKGPSLRDMRTKLPGLRYAVVVVDSDSDDMSIIEF
jgi:proteasome lid subunit RPN8/RPN11